MANIFKTDRVLFKYAPDKIPRDYITGWYDSSLTC